MSAVPTPRSLPPSFRVDRVPGTAVLANLGCKVNQSEMDEIERLLRAAGVRIVEPGQPADLVVVNTCAVTGVADRKSRHAVRHARRTSPDALTLVTGCSVELDAASFAAIDPALRLFGTDARSALVHELAGLLACGGDSGPAQAAGDGREALDPSGAAGEAAGREAVRPAVVDRPRIARTRAFVKVQDGCSFHCTYCIVPRARGVPRAVPAERVIADVLSAVADGHREVVLTGINIGTYEEPGGLAALVARILDETPVERIRLSSVEPQHVTEELLDVWAGARGRCMPHFHVPLQSGDDAILRRMGRRYDAATYAGVVERIRRRVPGAAIHADVIAGFPGEDEQAWANTIGLADRLDLAGLHVFRYSPRPGTPATRMAGQVDGETRKRRSSEALAMSDELRLRFARRQLGLDLEVLFESQLADGRWTGHAESYVEVAAAGSSLGGAIATVRASSLGGDGRLSGSVRAIRPQPTVSEPGQTAVR